MYFRAGAIGLILPCVMYPLSRAELFPAIETPFMGGCASFGIPKDARDFD